jgi:hypothetical protein
MSLSEFRTMKFKELLAEKCQEGVLFNTIVTCLYVLFFNLLFGWYVLFCYGW